MTENGTTEGLTNYMAVFWINSTNLHCDDIALRDDQYILKSAAEF